MSKNNILSELLNKIYINLSNLHGEQINTLTKQENVKKIIEDENKRLHQNKEVIDKAIDNQKRIIYFNDNNRKISLAYLRILVTIAITLGMVYLVRVIFYNFGNSLPDMLFNVLIVTIISIGIIVSVNYYLSIQYRDRYNFDELKLSPPKINYDAESENNLNGGGTLANCVGPYCCTPSTADSPGTQWSDVQGKCVYSPPTGMVIPTPTPTSISPTSTCQPCSPEPFYSKL